MWKTIRFCTVSTVILVLGSARIYPYYFGRREAEISLRDILQQLL